MKNKNRFQIREDINRLLTDNDYINSITIERMNNILDDYNEANRYIIEKNLNYAPEWLDVLNQYHKAIDIIKLHQRKEKILKIRQSK
jgi:hypothetical protein